MNSIKLGNLERDMKHKNSKAVGSVRRTNASTSLNVKCLYLTELDYKCCLCYAVSPCMEKRKSANPGEHLLNLYKNIVGVF